MKKINTFVLRFRAASLKIMLQILGLSGFVLLMSCTKYSSHSTKHDVPYTDNTINFFGKVLAEDSLNPIPGIAIKIYSEYEDTVYGYSNMAGIYSAYKYAWENQKVKLAFSDKDGAQNGKFIDKTIDVDVSFRDINNLEHEASVTLQRKP